ncbi:CPBP family intramembrane metalloprotease [Pleurocapsales cyanobacterium LEGE 10410]|nr:CPBP family intramembrane metalloprotease [Pleurocapsales cyanobacterium LEGE 10410]
MTMNSIFLIFTKRLSQAMGFTPSFAIALPNHYNWIILSISICIYLVFTLTFGLMTGFLHWDVCQEKRTIVKTIATTLIAPAFLEETFFRALLLPYPSDKIALDSYIAWATFSLLLFIIYHPLNALTFFSQGRATFFNPVFLGLATSLGIICTTAYWQTGSLWLPVIIHWLTVVIWLLCFSGLTRLKINSLI